VVPSVPGGEALHLYDFLARFPAVLLSDGFVSTHCFRVERHPAKAGMVGLAFEPNRRRVHDHDVAGVLWLPESVSAWPWIEFRYTKTPRRRQAEGVHLEPTR
jgi:hypothetical protein